MSSVFDFPGDIEDGEDSPNSPDVQETPEAEGKRPDDQQSAKETPQGVPDDSKIAALERQLNDVQSNLLNVIAENAALKTREKGAETEPKKPLYTAEELKEFGLQEDGRKQFDAARLYTDQALQEARTQLMSELQHKDKQSAVVSEMLEIYPDLKDPTSEFARKVENEKLSVMRRGIADDPVAAYNIALHKISKQAGPTRNESSEEYSRRVRIEKAGGEGAPAGQTPPEDRKETVRITKEDVEVGKRMGLDMSNKETRARFLKRKEHYESRRTR